MPFDANGNFSLVPGTIVSDGMTIQPSQHNPPFQDVANGLSQVVLRSGAAPMTGPLNMNGNKVSGVASGDQPGDVVTRADISNMAVDIGDGAWSVRDLGSDWLRRDGKLYSRADYPELADIMPPLPDGVSWETHISGASQQIQAVTFGQGRFTAIDEWGGIVGSEDGKTWLARGTVPRISGDNTFSGQSIAYGNGIYLAVAGLDQAFSVSPDGDTWGTPSTTPGGGGWRGVAYGDGKFVLVGHGGNISTTEDGVNLTARTSGTSYYLYAVHFTGTNWIAVGRSGTIVTSSDAISWTVRTSGVSVHLNGVTHYDGTYVVVGDDGVILTSTNMSGWTLRSSGVPNDLFAVVGGESGFMAVGQSGVARISSTGATWAPAATGITGTLRAAIIDPSNSSRYLVLGPTQTVLDGLRTSPMQFRVPNDDPTYGWIRAK